MSRQNIEYRKRLIGHQPYTERDGVLPLAIDAMTGRHHKSGSDQGPRTEVLPGAPSAMEPAHRQLLPFRQFKGLRRSGSIAYRIRTLT